MPLGRTGAGCPSYGYGLTPRRGGHGLRRDAAATRLARLRSRRRRGGAGRGLGDCGSKGGEVWGKIGRGARWGKRGDLRWVEFFSVFCGAGREGGWFAGALRIALLFCGDGFAKAAGFFARKGIGDGLGDGGLLRVTDEHVRPRVGLRKRVGATYELQAAQDEKQVAEEKLQILNSRLRRK